MKSVDDCDLYGDFGNKILYLMCENYPAHTDVETVHGKLWLIGRAYAAPIERKAPMGFKLKYAAQNLKDSGIDAKIGEIARIDRVDSSNITKVLDAHHYLTERFREVTGLAHRSLASKYLHFHARNAVFIYDSVASRKLGRELQTARSPNPNKTPSDYDGTYAAFAYLCLYYRDNILEPRLKAQASPREVDRWLYRP